MKHMLRETLTPNYYSGTIRSYLPFDDLMVISFQKVNKDITGKCYEATGVSVTGVTKPKNTLKLFAPTPLVLFILFLLFTLIKQNQNAHFI